MRRCVEVKKVRTNAQGHIWFSHINMMFSLFCDVLLVSFGFFFVFTSGICKTLFISINSMTI